MSAQKLLDVHNLTVTLQSNRGSATLVHDASFSVQKGECLGVLGESGSGKSMMWKAFMGLLDMSGKRFNVTGRAVFDSVDILSLPGSTMRRLRGSRICVILQNPMTCFDPLCRIGYQMAEGMAERLRLSRWDVRKKCVETLESMRIVNPEEVLEKYPHQLSGGMLQRVMTGLALSMKPDLIIADEPTTAIDSVTQFQVIEEFKRIKECHGVAMIFISHDIGVVAKLADEVIVMRDSVITQRGTTRDVIEHPTDPYTRFLLDKKMAVTDRFVRMMKREERADALC